MEVEGAGGAVGAGVGAEEGEDVAGGEDYVVEEEDAVVGCAAGLFFEERLEGEVACACEVGDAADLFASRGVRWENPARAWVAVGVVGTGIDLVCVGGGVEGDGMCNVVLGEESIEILEDLFCVVQTARLVYRYIDIVRSEDCHEVEKGGPPARMYYLSIGPKLCNDEDLLAFGRCR